MLTESSDPNSRDVFTGDILRVNLEAGQYEQAKQLIANRLLNKDLSEVDVVANTVEQYLAKADEVELSALIEALKGIEIEQSRPLWQGRLSKWAALVSIAEPNSPE